MIGMSLGSWSTASGSVFTRRRLYWRGRWTPLVLVNLRYLTVGR